jgi:NADPH:quinone reductase-like Zn-dependent oxidoreductase
MATATAWAQNERDGKQVLVQEQVQLPSREPHQSLVSVQYVAQNPTDGEFLHPTFQSAYNH